MIDYTLKLLLLTYNTIFINDCRMNICKYNKE